MNKLKLLFALFITTVHTVHCQDTLNILYKNVIPSEYQISYNQFSGVQTIYYADQVNPQHITIYSKSNFKELIYYLEDNFNNINSINNKWITKDNKYEVTLSTLPDSYLLIKQRIY